MPAVSSPSSAAPAATPHRSAAIWTHPVLSVGARVEPDRVRAPPRAAGTSGGRSHRVTVGRAP